MTEFQDAELIHDTRVNCTSLMVAMTVQDYLNLVGEAYKERGGISGQREPLKTTSAKRIRKRMVEDLLAGAVLPPVVIGKVVESLNGLDTNDAIKAEISNHDKSKLSIIDGMQRTTALMEAFDVSRDKIESQIIRVEFWIAEETGSLIYRMLVLNTGQVPWNLSRQLQVVLSQLIAEMKEKITFQSVLNTDEGERRTRAGQYRPDDLAELFIAFGRRKTDVDTKEALADEFSKLDLAEAIADRQHKDIFYPTVQMLVDLDLAFSRLDEQISQILTEDDVSDRNVVVGRKIFDSKPARVGFVVAITIAIMGRVGMEKDKDKAAMLARLAEIQNGLRRLIESLATRDPEELSDFLKLGVLDQQVYGQKRSAVGRYEREFFEKAFNVLIDENFDVPSMEPCWRV